MISRETQTILTYLILALVGLFFVWKFFLFSAAPAVSRWMLSRDQVKFAMWLRRRCKCD